MRRNLVSTKRSGGRKESESIRSRGDIKIGIIFRTEKTVSVKDSVSDLQTALQNANSTISWANPVIGKDQVFFPVQYSTEETERVSNETKLDYLVRLFGIDTGLLENKLEYIAKKLNSQQLPGVAEIKPIANFHSTLT